jgi:hypothetical protein
LFRFASVAPVVPLLPSKVTPAQNVPVGIENKGAPPFENVNKPTVPAVKEIGLNVNPAMNVPGPPLATRAHSGRRFPQACCRSFLRSVSGVLLSRT